MEKKKVLGHIDCPTCKFAHMEVKEDKHGKAFAYCPDCSTQVFTRNEYRDKRMRSNMRPVSVTVTVTEQEVAQVTAKPPVSVPVSLGIKTPVPEKKPDQQKTPAPKKSAWLTPILAG